MASWCPSDHFDSHFPWKQFNQVSEREPMVSDEKSERVWLPIETGSRSLNWLLLVRPDGQPVYEQREQ